MAAGDRFRQGLGPASELRAALATGRAEIESMVAASERGAKVYVVTFKEPETQDEFAQFVAAYMPALQVRRFQEVQGLMVGGVTSEANELGNEVVRFGGDIAMVSGK